MKPKPHDTVEINTVEDICFNSGGATIQADDHGLYIWTDGDGSHEADLIIKWTTLGQIQAVRNLLKGKS